MPRLRNTQTGAVVSVNDATAKRLGPVWVSAAREPEGESTSKRKPKK